MAQPWCERRFPFVCLHSLCLFVLFLWKSIPGAENWIHTCSSPLTFNLIFEQLAVQLRFNYSRDISEQSVKMVIYIYVFFFSLRHKLYADGRSGVIKAIVHALICHFSGGFESDCDVKAGGFNVQTCSARGEGTSKRELKTGAA